MMKFRKSVVTLIAASLAFWIPSVVPTKAVPVCGAVQLITADTAFAGVLPCPVLPGQPPAPWAAITIGAGVVSLMFNAAVVQMTQCRELTTNEALQSAFLPFIGMALNQQTSHCGH